MTEPADPPVAPRWRPPPPVVLLVPFAAAVLASRVWPWPIPYESTVRTVGLVLVFGSLGLMYWATSVMDDAGTTTTAWRQGSALVTGGPFRFSRHPAYLAFVGWYVGAALVIGTWWPLAVLPVVVLVLDRWIVAREEALLAARFGAEYAAYRARVRRWV